MGGLAAGRNRLVGICSLRMYNNVVERCFRDCVESFRRKDLESNEERVSVAASLCWTTFHMNLWESYGDDVCLQRIELCTQQGACCPLNHSTFTACAFFLQCVTRCCEKFMKHSARVGMRFGELSSQAEQQMQQQVMQQQTGR